MPSVDYCRGKRPQASGQLLGICIACAKLRAVGPFDLEPLAAMSPRRVWVCVNWSAEPAKP